MAAASSTCPLAARMRSQRCGQDSTGVPGRGRCGRPSSMAAATVMIRILPPEMATDKARPRALVISSPP
ncbi:MAG TPA: hypothetical protein VMU95_28130 [Trebonia sp.]|nr:hypothetical protein [Trebonia sp.]